MKLYKKLLKFAKNILRGILSVLKDFISNIESVIILVLASSGLTAIFNTLTVPFPIPTFLHAHMIPPVLAVLVILLLLKLTTWKQTRYEKNQPSIITS